MARIFGCAVDWTFDRFMEDMRRYEAAGSIKEAAAAPSDDYRGYFAVWFKTAAKSFREEWLKSHKGLYDAYDGWCGDAFAAKRIRADWFSDFYKDAYGQRPHLAPWFYVQAVGLPMKEDTIRTFCASPVEDAEYYARRVRNGF